MGEEERGVRWGRERVKEGRDREKKEGEAGKREWILRDFISNQFTSGRT